MVYTSCRVYNGQNQPHKKSTKTFQICTKFRRLFVSAEFCCSATLISVLFLYFFYDSVLSWPPSCLFYSVLSYPGIIESVYVPRSRRIKTPSTRLTTVLSGIICFVFLSFIFATEALQYLPVIESHNLVLPIRFSCFGISCYSYSTRHNITPFLFIFCQLLYRK